MKLHQQYHFRESEEGLLAWDILKLIKLSAKFLYEEWLPNSGEKLGDFPIFFHYVNIEPDIKAEEMITDVYLLLQ